MNIADSEEMFSHLAARGMVTTDNLDEADVVLINTCTVRDHAEHRAVSFLGRLGTWKKEKPGRAIIFAGCAAQRLGRQLRRHFPFLDVLSGAKDIENFSDTLDNSGLFPPTTDGGEILKPGLTGYVTIMRGCNFACTYCIVPTVRGPIKCLAQEDILNSVRQKVDQGAKEIMLLGQTVNAYQDGNTTFADLLNRTTEIPGVERVRFTSRSTKVLGEMKRGYTREILLEKIKELKSCGFHISTDLIVGFPTETEEDFQQTLTLVEEAGFSTAYCYKYSPRQGTVAAQMTLLPEKILEQRLDILLNKVRGLAEAAYKAQVGTVQEVLLESENKGRSSGSYWVKLNKNYPIGTVVKAEIERAEGTLLFARD